MTFLNVQAPTRRAGPAFIAGIALFIAGAAAIGGVNLFGVRVGFGFFPLIILLVWPRRADTRLSLFLVFLAGLFMDWATAGILGQWGLIFVLVWGFLRPEYRSSPFAPVMLFLIWLAACGLTILVLSLSGYFVFRILPDLSTLGRQMILATILLPVILLLRHGLALRFGDGEEWG